MPEPSPDPPTEHKYLHRLDPAAYQGLAQIHWTHTIADRAQGWLTPTFHLRFREILTHTTFRYGLVCPIYCLMPDHLHLLLFGYRDNSDQRLATKFLRKHLNALLRLTGLRLQKQAHDHILRDTEKNRDAISDLATYIRNNPVRANLAPSTDSYPFTSCLAPGYPELDINAPDFWQRLWRIYTTLQNPT